MSYTVIDPDKMISSLELLSRRIQERFPQSGLYQVSMQLLTFGKNAQEDARWIARPILPLRIGVALLVVLLIAAPCLDAAQHREHAGSQGNPAL